MSKTPDLEYLLQHVGLIPTGGSWVMVTHGQPAPPKFTIFWTGLHRETAEEEYILNLAFSPKTNRYYFFVNGTICELRVQKKLF